MADPIELHRPPRAEVSLTEEEIGAIRWALSQATFVSPRGRQVVAGLREKVDQLARIETQPGGKFFRGGSAA